MGFLDWMKARSNDGPATVDVDSGATPQVSTSSEKDILTIRLHLPEGWHLTRKRDHDDHTDVSIKIIDVELTSDDLKSESQSEDESINCDSICGEMCIGYCNSSQDGSYTYSDPEGSHDSMGEGDQYEDWHSGMR